MIKSKISSLSLINLVLWGANVFSALALVYHIRWFIPFLQNNVNGVIPGKQMPFIWFIVQIGNNLIFLYVGFLLIKLFRKFEQTGFFDNESLRVFDGVINSSLGLALLGTVQLLATNLNELHFSEWTSLAGISNLLFRSFTRLLIFQEPQTMYFLLAIILWAVKQFVIKALIIKNENEAFV